MTRFTGLIRKGVAHPGRIPEFVSQKWMHLLGRAKERTTETRQLISDHAGGFLRSPRSYLLDQFVFRRRLSGVFYRPMLRLTTSDGFGLLKDRNQYHVRRHFRKGHLELCSYPKLLHLEMSTHCNLKCRFCSIVRPGRNRRLQHLDMEVVERLRSVLPFIRDTKIHGGGEPFLNPNIERIIEIFQENEVRLNTVTNATVINDRLARLIGETFATLTVSIDGATAPTFELARDGAKFDRVLQSIDLLNHHRRPGFKLILGFVILKCNAHELPEMIRLATKHGAQEVQAAWVVSFADLPWSLEQDPTREPERMNRHLNETYQAAEEAGISVKLPPLLPVNSGQAKVMKSHRPTYRALHPTNRVEGQCRLMYDRAMILVDGTVKPCGQSRSVPDLGNVREQTFEEIWSGAGYQRLRRTFNEGILPDTCSGCNFIRSGQLGSARLMVEDENGDLVPLMALDKPR